ncbi:MAG: ribose 5-phosphate isomerase B [Bradymonadales bacterium]|nr:ribose 5-phosphate isomerase B [Bradymonadales bacterium]
MSPATSDVVIANDHAGFHLKKSLVAHLEGCGLTVVDLGAHSADPVDYPDYAQQLAQWILAGRASWGILICGSGIGMSMAANRIPGVRAARVQDPYSARMAREHNDANVLALGERIVGVDLAIACVDAFRHTEFQPGEDGRHLRRVRKMEVGRD